MARRGKDVRIENFSLIISKERTLVFPALFVENKTPNVGTQ
jgi:hypothetical protein